MTAVAAAPVRLAGYAAELAKIDAALVDAGEQALVPPTDTARVTAFVSLRYQRAALTGDLGAVSAIPDLVERALPLVSHPDDLLLLTANAAFKLHRLDRVRATLEASPTMARSAEGRRLAADLLFQTGDSDGARGACESLVEEEGRWDDLARLAHLVGHFRGVDEADALYREAEDLLTAKEMRHYAWLEVQRGHLQFSRGCCDAALAHCERAERAYPGYWFVAEHRGEILAAAGDVEAALEIFRSIVTTHPRPDLEQAMGEMYDLAGREAEARACHRRALDGYRVSAAAGEVHYWHHLVDFLSDVAEGSGTEAVHWARRDLELRENFATQGALAWALYRNREFDEAGRWMDRSLASGVVDARLFARAATILEALGRTDESEAFRRRSSDLNPIADGFHVHH